MESPPPRAFRVLPPDTAPAAARVWTAWDPSQGTTPRPRNLGRVGASHRDKSWDSQTALNDLTAALAADRVYESVGALAADRRAQLAALEASREFRLLQRPDFSRGCQASWRRCRAHRVSSPSCLTLGRSQLTIATIMRVVKPCRGNSLVRVRPCRNSSLFPGRSACPTREAVTPLPSGCPVHWQA